MRKTIIRPESVHAHEEWLNLEQLAAVEVTSEDPNFPIESAFGRGQGSGWRAAEKGQQVIRLVLDEPRPLCRIRLEFSESENPRTQEFTLRWSRPDGPMTEIVRQQWTFSPRGSTSEVEDYQVNLDSVSILELVLKPDLRPETAFASLAAWRIS